MSESQSPTDVAAVLTGEPRVDAVLASLEGLDEVAVHEHVAVFERAHDALRRTLADAGPGVAPAPRG